MTVFFGIVWFRTGYYLMYDCRYLYCLSPGMSKCMATGSLAPPLRRAGGGAEESGDTAIQSVAERNAIIGS